MLAAGEVARTIAGVLAEWVGRLVQHPLADGGEGTVGVALTLARD